jgi:signal peptidase
MALLGMAVVALVFVALAPRLFGLHMVVVEGKSMEPHIHYGALAIVRDTSADNVNAGDVVEFTAPQTHWVTTHRIIAIAPDRSSFTTKGDANNAADVAALPASQIHAKYLFSLPEVGNLIRWLHTRDGYLAIVLIPGGAIILFELLSIGREVRKPQDESVVSSQ